MDLIWECRSGEVHDVFRRVAERVLVEVDGEQTRPKVVRSQRVISEDVLRDRAKKLFDDLLKTADRETLLMLCPLLARIGESPTRRK